MSWILRRRCSSSKRTPRATARIWTSRPSRPIEQLAYQAGNQYIIEISPKKEEVKKDPNAPPDYSGNRVTFNFQDIPTRSVLQLIADVSDLNIVVADTVGGNVTLRLINVPWDQALDIVLQAKGLDKRRNGNVIWVAPQKEIADREQALADSKQEAAGTRRIRSPFTSRSVTARRRISQIY